MKNYNFDVIYDKRIVSKTLTNCNDFEHDTRFVYYYDSKNELYKCSEPLHYLIDKQTGLIYVYAPDLENLMKKYKMDLERYERFTLTKNYLSLVEQYKEIKNG